MATPFQKNIAAPLDHLQRHPLVKGFIFQRAMCSFGLSLNWIRQILGPDQFHSRLLRLWEEDVNKNKDLVANFLFSSLYSKLWQELLTLCCATKDTYAGLQFCVWWLFSQQSQQSHRIISVVPIQLKAAHTTYATQNSKHPCSYDFSPFFCANLVFLNPCNYAMCVTL